MSSFIVNITCVLVGLQVQSDVYCLRWLLLYLQYGPSAASVSALLRPPVPTAHDLAMFSVIWHCAAIVSAHPRPPVPIVHEASMCSAIVSARP